MSKQDYILILEDDADQMQLLVGLVMEQLRILVDDVSMSTEQRARLKRVGVVKVTSIDSLKRAIEQYKSALVAILDCNVPDRRGEFPKDQFIKSKHRITGQHVSVDLVHGNMKDTQIILTSSMNRFKVLVSQHYKQQEDLDLSFVNKADLSGLKRAVRACLKRTILVVHG